MPGDCHYLEGNVNANRRVKRVQELLEQIGLEPERVQMFNLSSAMAGKFVESIQEMTEKVNALGLNPLRHSKTNDKNSTDENQQEQQSALKAKVEVSP